MIEFNEDVPFLWRLSSHDSEGFCVVSMVVPFSNDGESMEHTIETDILSFVSDISGNEEEELEWNEDDLSLFLKLIANRGKNAAARAGETIRVDLADPDTIEIIQIVAAAGFGLALPADEIVAFSGKTLLSGEFDIGSTVSINTAEGFKRCVVVEFEDENVVCVILDKIEQTSPGQYEAVNPYDLLLLKRHHILLPAYTTPAPVATDPLH